MNRKNKFVVDRYKIAKNILTPVRIVSLSDLHGKLIDTDKIELIDLILSENPDIVVLTGDIVDSHLRGLAHTVELAESLAKKVPVFAVLGNHERRSGKADAITDLLRAKGIAVLQNEISVLQIGETQVNILGLAERQAINRMDYLFAAFGKLRYENHDRQLRELSNKKGLRIVLSHFPENFAQIGKLSYARHRFDLMFSGHTHGGQIRLPFVGGLFAAGQGFFPLFDAGFFRIKNGPALIVSSGLANDTMIPRVNNRPKIVSVTIFPKS